MTSPTLKADVTEERVRSMLAAALLATPGPWHFVEENVGLMPDHGYGLLHGQPGAGGWEENLYLSVGCSVRATDALGAGVPEANAAHIANCDPQTISSILTELLSLRERVRGAARDVLAERQRQVEVEGWTPEHDDEHRAFELSRAAATYALWGTSVPLNGQRHVGSFRTKTYSIWPWGGEWWKPRDRRRNLVKAGALILAEIERLDRAALSNSGEGENA